MSKQVQLTVERVTFYEPVTYRDFNGREARMNVPPEARPDCATCPKPDLIDRHDQEAVFVYQMLIHQQHVNMMTGARLGLRIEAAIQSCAYFEERGSIGDRDEVFDRLWIIDRVYNRLFNDQLKKSRDDADDPPGE